MAETAEQRMNRLERLAMECALAFEMIARGEELTKDRAGDLAERCAMIDKDYERRAWMATHPGR